MILAILSTVTTVYGVGGAGAILLQARQMRRRHCSADVSLPYLGTYLGGYALFLAYGLAISSLTLILSDGVGLICGGFTLGTAILYRHCTRKVRP